MHTSTKICLLILSLAILEIECLPRQKRQNGFTWADNQGPQRPSTTPAGNGGTTTTTPSPQYASCVRQCPITPQYNPICGTNRVTYSNESHLRCAQRCGLSVQRAFGGSCQAL